MSVMTDNEINVAVAEECGITVTPEGIYKDGRFNGRGMSEVTSMLPDYAKDLNAIHSAVNTLSTERKEIFLACLARILDGKDEHDDRWLPAKIVEATPRDWCRAFLCTIGKWRD